jgi:hypothetical protein
MITGVQEKSDEDLNNVTWTNLPFTFKFPFTTSLYDQPLLAKWIDLDCTGIYSTDTNQNSMCTVYFKYHVNSLNNFGQEINGRRARPPHYAFIYTHFV